MVRDCLRHSWNHPRRGRLDGVGLF
jgi:hypothetical protein